MSPVFIFNNHIIWAAHHAFPIASLARTMSLVMNVHMDLAIIQRHNNVNFVRITVWLVMTLLAVFNVLMVIILRYCIKDF